MRHLFLGVLAIGSCVTGSLSHHVNHSVHGRHAVEPVVPAKTHRLEAYRYITIHIGLTQQNLDGIEETLMSVSHPDSPTYGQHWSAEKVIEHFSPCEATVTAVESWLVMAGFQPDRLHRSRSKGWISIRTNVSDIEFLLKLGCDVHTHSSGHERISCEPFSVPEEIREHVELIRVTHGPKDAPPKYSNHIQSNALSFVKPLPDGITTGVASSSAPCYKSITPQCLRQLYSIDIKPKVPHLNSFGVVEFTPQAYLGSDLDLFFANFSTSQEKKRPVLVSIDGGSVHLQNQSSVYDGEGDLDLEYAMALTDPTPVILLQTGDLIQGASFDNWLDAVDGSFCTFQGGDDPNIDPIYPDRQPGGFDHPESCGIIAPPKVVAVSYNVDEYSITAKYALRQCYEYAKLGLMGTTILYSSGDYGVAGYNNSCLDPVNVGGRGRFSPSFPATCPYVTAVGATQINQKSTVYEPESACEQYAFSGGGFSNIFPMPGYQEAAVNGYLKYHPPPYTTAQYNNSGMVRAYPDLSANGANFVYIRNGTFYHTYGTSASVQIIGAIVTLINDARIALGKTTVGFINPIIYFPVFSSAFHDITNGSNKGCGTPGFTATKGWDPVTGIGTPNTTALLDIFLQLL